MTAARNLLIGIVGPCAAGKSTLLVRLQSTGFRARHIAQEHSYVADMWKRITNPDVLVYLEVSFENSLERRALDWTRADYAEQLRRLSHAHAHADIIVETDPLSPDEVYYAVRDFVEALPPA